MRFFSNKKQLIIGGVTLAIGLLIYFVFWLTKLNETIDQQLLKKQFAPSTELYSAPEKFFKGQTIYSEKLVEALKTRRYRERSENQPLQEKDFAKWGAEVCSERLDDALDDIQFCYAFRSEVGFLNVLAWGRENQILDVFAGQPLSAITLTELEPLLFAQYYGSDPIIRQIVELGDAPPLCLNGLLAIEDATFLEHSGVNLKSIGRAFIKNISAGRVVQGGSTITQQLVKNYFLTHERKFSRKIREFFMALLLESKSTKDQILEAYINEIYMGQTGPFQIRGFSAAAEHYFGKPLRDLDLPECALLAALVNGPGVYTPFTQPQKAKDRRKLVLEKMLEKNIISQTEFDESNLRDLPTQSKKVLSEPAPFFVDAVMKKINEMGLDLSLGLKIETTLDLQAQEAAQQTIRDGVKSLETNLESIKMLKASGKNLEAVLVSADPTNGYVQAIVGGASFKKSQFNRAIQSKRQVGSVMKPFVYLASLDVSDEFDQSYTPISLLEDKKFSIEYEKQSWSPDNYDNEYFGQIPLYMGLIKSLNSCTAQLGLNIGLDRIINTAHDFGITSVIKPFPALTLGAFELGPLEVLEAYNGFARMGEHIPLTYIRRIKSLDDEVLFEHTIKREQVYVPSSVAVLVGMLKAVITNGTARGVQWGGLHHPAAGKTGTTNDKKDAWFAGFTPLHSAVVWVGYDDNTPHGLTGSQAAVPIWTNYMKKVAGTYPPIDFHWPDDVELRTINVQTQKSLGVKEEKDKPLSDIQLVFKKN